MTTVVNTNDALDTFYNYVRARVLAMTPTRLFGGMVDATEWPPDQVKMEAFYLLILGGVPVNHMGSSAARPVSYVTVQWTWLIRGTDLTTGLLGNNRGDRGRLNDQMKSEIQEAMFPGFTDKLNYTLSSSGVLGTTSLRVPITWTPPSFVPRRDQGSGVLYQTASSVIRDTANEIVA